MLFMFIVFFVLIVMTFVLAVVFLPLVLVFSDNNRLTLDYPALLWSGCLRGTDLYPDVGSCKTPTAVGTKLAGAITVTKLAAVFRIIIFTFQL
jgi:hypothetical protein